MSNIAIPNEDTIATKDVKRKRKGDENLSGGSTLLKRMKEGLENKGRMLPIPVSLLVVIATPLSYY